MAEKQVTYADVVTGDVIIDKSGGRWYATPRDAIGADAVELWLGTEKTPAQHLIVKRPDAVVTVDRPESQAEEVTRREAEVDEAQGAPAEEPLTTEETAEALGGGAVVAEETAAHADARKQATVSGEPFGLPPFSKLTDPEMRSHIYLVHGTYAHDLTTRKSLEKLHDELHADGAEAPGRHAAHHHEAKGFPA